MAQLKAWSQGCTYQVIMPFISTVFRNSRELIVKTLTVLVFLLSPISSASSNLVCEKFYKQDINNSEAIYSRSSSFDFLNEIDRSNFLEISRNFTSKVFSTFRKMRPISSEALARKFGGLDNTLNLLKQLGYNSIVSRNLINTRPDLAYQILIAKKWGLEKLVKAVTAYRVIRIQNESDFKPDYFSPRYQKEIYVGESIEACIFFAHGNPNSNITMVLEVQVPNILLRNPPKGLSGRFISSNDASDISPFLNKAGIINWKDSNNHVYSIIWRNPTNYLNSFN